MARILSSLTLFFALFLASLTGYAAQINVPQTFGNGAVLPTLSDGEVCMACILNGWVGQLALDAGQGGVGDHALIYDNTAFGPPGPAGFHFLAADYYFPDDDPNFSGDFVAAGVTGVRFRARHSGTGDSVKLRVFLFDSFDDGDGMDFSTSIDWALSINSSVEILNTDTTWQMYQISLLPADLQAGAHLYDPPRRTVEDILSAVSQFGLRHDPSDAGPGNPAHISAIVYFDDIELIGTVVPVPAAAWLFGSALGLLGWLKRKSA